MMTIEELRDFNEKTERIKRRVDYHTNQAVNFKGFMNQQGIVKGFIGFLIHLLRNEICIIVNKERD